VRLTRIFECFVGGDRARLPAVLSVFRLRSLWKAGLCCASFVGIGCLMGAMAFFLCHGRIVWGQSPEGPDAVNSQYEYNVKAAFIYSFGRYVEWPQDAFEGKSGPFVLGVCGEDPFGQAMDRIAQAKTIQGRKITIQRMVAIEDLQNSHILFISHTLPLTEQIAIIDRMRGKPTLLVGETPGFAEHGGGVNFFLEGGTVRFEINVDAIRQKKLVLDAKLLNLGKRIPETAAGQAKNSPTK